MHSRRIRFATLGLLMLFVLGVGAVAAGGSVSDKLRTGETVSVDAGETVDHDLYVFAGDVVVDGTVAGDLVAGAGTVVINGTIEGDLTVGAGRVFIPGEVSGDVRSGSGEISVGGTIGEDLVAGSGRLTVEETGEIGEDLIFGAGTVLVEGAVVGSVMGTASEYTRSGTVGGTEDVRIEAGLDPGEPDEPEPVEVVRDGLAHLVTVLILGGLALLLVPGAVRASETALRTRPLASAGIGIGVLVGYLIQFIAVILLMILLAIAFAAAALDALAGIALWLGVIDLMVTSFLLFVSASFLVDAVVGIALAQLVARGWAKDRWQEFVLLLGGAFVVVLVTSLPVIGPIAKLVVVVLGLGAMAIAFGALWRRIVPPAGPPPIPPLPPVTAPAAAAAPAPEAPAPRHRLRLQRHRRRPPAPAAEVAAATPPAKRAPRKRTKKAAPPSPPPDDSAI